MTLWLMMSLWHHVLVSDSHHFSWIWALHPHLIPSLFGFYFYLSLPFLGINFLEATYLWRQLSFSQAILQSLLICLLFPLLRDGHEELDPFVPSRDRSQDSPWRCLIWKDRQESGMWPPESEPLPREPRTPRMSRSDFETMKPSKSQGRRREENLKRLPNMWQILNERMPNSNTNISWSATGMRPSKRSTGRTLAPSMNRLRGSSFQGKINVNITSVIITWPSCLTSHADVHLHPHLIVTFIGSVTKTFVIIVNDTCSSLFMIMC